jgi:hypothetical protein
MKTPLGFSIFAAALAVATLAGEPRQPTAAPAIPAQRLQAIQRAKTAIIDQRLGLTDEQEAKVKAIRAQAAAAAKVVRENPALTPQQKREQLAAADQAAREQWRAQLTPDQLVKLGQITSHPQQLTALAVRRVRTAAIAREIGVTPEQQTSLRAIQSKTAAAVKAIRADATLAPAQQQAKVRELTQAGRKEVSGVLSAPQRMKLEQIRKRLLAPLGSLA